MTDFEDLLDSVAKRPGMYIGRCSIRSLSHYLQGYDHALHRLGQIETPLCGWQRWVESRFLISHPAWSWGRILLHSFGNDSAAVEALPKLYQEFLALRATLGNKDIEAERTRRFMIEYGEDWHEPVGTETTLDC